MRPTGAVSVCAISDGGDGMVAQAGGLARAVAALSGGAIQSAIVARRAGGGFLPPSWGALWGALWSVGGDAIDSVAPGCVAIGCGARAQAAVLAAKKQRDAFAVCVQRPVFDEARFDAVVAPRHDYSESEIAAIEAAPAPKTVLTLGAVGPVDAAFVGARRAAALERFATFRAPRVAVLLGGENRAYAIEADAVCEQLQAVARAADARLLVTPSRRSPPGLAAALRATLGESHYVWDGGGENPYVDMLAAADGFCATVDSINMISEACAVGRAVWLLPLPQKSGLRARRGARKFARFHDELAAQKRARLWRGEWRWFESPPLAETARAARAVWEIHRQAQARE